MAAPIEICPFAADPAAGIGPDSGGAEVRGLAADAVTDASVTKAWHAALDAHQILVFRDLDLDADEQVALLETLGPALVENDAGRRYQFVSNVHEEGILGDERFGQWLIDRFTIHSLDLAVGNGPVEFVQF